MVLIYQFISLWGLPLIFLLVTDQDDRKRQYAKQESTFSDLEYPNKVRNIGIAALVSSFAMVAYALTTGIIQVKYSCHFFSHPVNTT